METIHIYHTNDIHSHLENWPRIQQFLKQKREWHQTAGEEVFLFDIGDFIDRWHPFTEASKGKGNIGLLNDAHYTAVTIGNNEGITLPYEALDELYDEAQFDILAANLYKKNDSYPDWVKPYQIYRTKKGTRIGVIGLTAHFAILYELLGWNLTDPTTELEKWLPQLREQADIIILLSHLGIRDDERIAAAFPEIDIILGAHTHHFFEKGKTVGNTLLGAAGKYGYFVGHITVHVDKQKIILQKDAVLYDVKELPTIPGETEIIESFIRTGREMLSTRITTLWEPLLSNPFAETNLSQLLCRALREWCEADCAMINAGLLLGPLSGDVTEYELLTICPHPINPCVVDLTGEELREVLLESRDEQLHHREIKGLGFRGTALGLFIYDRIEFRTDGIFINKQPLEMERHYTLALPDMFTFGHFFKSVLPNKTKRYYLPELLRDLLKWKLMNRDGSLAPF